MEVTKYQSDWVPLLAYSLFLISYLRDLGDLGGLMTMATITWNLKF